MATDIAKTCFGGVRVYAEGNELAVACSLHSAVESAPVALAGRDVVIGRKDMQYDIEAKLILRLCCSSSYGHRCVPGDWFEHDAGQRHPHLGRLLGYDETVFGIGDDDGRGVALNI